MSIKKLAFSTVLLALPLSFALAQNNGSVPPAPVASPISSITPAATTTKPATKKAPAKVVKALVATSTPVIATSSTSTPPTLPIVDTTNNTGTFFAWILGAIVAIALSWYGIFKAKMKKNDKGRCFDIKRIMDEKLEEITDLKGQLKGRLEDKGRDVIRKSLTGTATGEVLAKIEAAEKEYNKLKKLFEECMIEFETRTFKGTIVESSLRDKGILDKMKIDKTRQVEDWILHDVSIPEKEIRSLSSHIADGPWYIHLWEEGKDEIKVVFKQKIFTIKAKDKSTWKEAIAYAKSIGIPEDQVDFPIT